MSKINLIFTILAVFYALQLQAQSSPRALKQQSIILLENASSNEQRIQRNIEKTIVFIERSLIFKDVSNFLDDFRISSKTGKIVFINSSKATAIIATTIANSKISPEVSEVLQQVSSLLVESDKAIANLSLQIAQQMVGVLQVDSRNLGKAISAFVEGEQQPNPTKAIRAFHKAWQFSQKSLSRKLTDLVTLNFNDTPDPFIPGSEENILKVNLLIEKFKPGLSFSFKQVIKDATGQTIRTITKDQVSFPRSLNVSIESKWDGKNDQGNVVPSGKYRYFAFTQFTNDKNGNLEQLSFPIEGIITVAGPPPEITAINPNQGSNTKKTLITISGRNFQNGIIVFFGANQAREIEFINSNTIHCKTPTESSAPIVDVIVQNTDGQSHQLNDAFEYLNKPSVTSINPSVGNSIGGTSVTILGNDLQTITTVFFGANETQNIVVNKNKVVCTAPPKTSSEFTINLIIKNSFGSDIVMQDAFTYFDSPLDVFSDITATNFPATPGTAGNCFFDIDGDGDLDNVDTKANFRGNNVFINDGVGVFTLAPNNANIPTNSEGHSSFSGDIDNDGDMDLIIGWFFVGGSKVFRNDNAIFTDISASSGVGNPKRIHGGALADIDQDGDLDLSFAVDGSNLLYINDGSGNFHEDGENRGVNVKNFGISTLFADIDNDGDLDLLTTSVKTDNGTKILQNDGTGHFEDITELSGVNSIRSETCCFGDIDNDGDLDLYQGGIAVYTNNGSGIFADITTQTGIVPENVSLRSCMWVDVNNDGHLDLWENGNLWLNNGDLTFIDATNTIGLGNLGDQQNACFGDIDGDGDLDIKSSNRLIRNNSNNSNFLIVRPNAKLNSLSHNAKVSVYKQGQLGNQDGLLGYREVMMGTVRLSGSIPYAHFGLPDDKFVDVRVIFLDGTVKDKENVQRGATITLFQSENQ